MLEKIKAGIKSNYKGFIVGGIATFAGLLIYGSVRSKDEDFEDDVFESCDEIETEGTDLTEEIPFD